MNDLLANIAKRAVCSKYGHFWHSGPGREGVRTCQFPLSHKEQAMKPDITKPAVRAELKAHYELHSSGDALIITHCFDYIDRLEKAANKLPKDAEGVHCGPGDRRWAWTHPGGGKAAVLQGGVFWEPGGEPDWRIGFGIKAHPAGVFAGFSTKEAAENCAALAQQAKDTEHGSDTEG